MVDLYPGIVAITITISKEADIFGYLSALSNLILREFDIHILRRADTTAFNKFICEFISKQCSLQSLRIHCSVLQSETITKLLRNLKDLTCFYLSSSTDDNGFMLTALPELPKLTALELVFTSVNDKCLKNIATKAPHLKTLTLWCCGSVSDIGIGYIADCCHCLERLEINNCGDIQCVRLFPSTLVSLGKGFKKLKHLALRTYTGLDDSCVIDLVQSCHDLEYLELRSKNISSPSLHAITHFCSNLFHLEIAGYDFNAASVESLLTRHRFIKHVSIESCSNINEIDLCKSTETKSGILKTHSHASFLSIRGKTDIGYSVIEQIVTFCPDLCFLSLSPIDNAVQDDAMEIAFHKCSFLEIVLL